MKLFHEIYNRYLGLISELLIESQKGGLTRARISEAIQEKGFFYENTEFEAALLNESKRGDLNKEVLANLNLLVKGDNGTYTSGYMQAPRRVLPTRMESMWLKMILADERARLFLSPETVMELEQGLEDFRPLYEAEQAIFRNLRTNGDPYLDPSYVAIFRKLLIAIQQNHAILVMNAAQDGRIRETRMLPLRLEYSIKDDVFRVCGAVTDEQGEPRAVSMRLSRIRQVEMADGDVPDVGFAELMERKKALECATIEITNIRNGYERFLHFFSNYARRARYNEETGILEVELDYYEFDQNELIVSILAMGPVVKVTGPSSLRQQVIDRLRKQNAYLQ